MISLGIDIGTTTTRATAVRITPGSFGKRELEILAGSFCALTPYDENRDLRGDEILALLEGWVATQRLPAPDLGTLLFTGEAQRAPSARAVAERIGAKWEGLLSAQLNPQLESILAAHGAHAVALSAQRLGTPVLHIDVGGGTSNLAWIENGRILDTACYDLGARKWIFDPQTLLPRSRSPQARLLEATFPEIGTEPFTAASAARMAEAIAKLILGASPAQKAFEVVGWARPRAVETAILSLSGGIVDCLTHPPAHPFVFGDLGPLLAEALVTEAKAQGREVHLSSEEGRATALGVSAFSFQLSGGSIHADLSQSYYNVPLLTAREFRETKDRLSPVAIWLGPFTGEVEGEARAWRTCLEGKGLSAEDTVIFLLRANLAKTFGYYLQREWPAPRLRLLILDEIDLEEGREDFGLRTLDLRITPASRRYAVVVKALRIF